MGELISFKTKERVSDVPLGTSPSVIIAAAVALSERDQYKVYSALGAEIRKRDAEREKVAAEQRRLRLEEAERLGRERARELEKRVDSGAYFLIQFGPMKSAVRKEKAVSALLTAVIAGTILLVLSFFAPSQEEMEVRLREMCEGSSFASPECLGY